MAYFYFDNAATTRLDEEVLHTMLPFLKEYYGNSSSIYQLGQESKRAIERAREKVASVLHCASDEVYFTSGGSESDNMAIKGIAHRNKNRGNHIITSKVEHPAVLETCRQLEREGFDVSYIDVDSLGRFDLERLRHLLCERTILITLIFANHEIGTIEPIQEVGEIAREHHVCFHTDAVQAIGNIALNVNELHIDALSLSAHKFYGPKGVGAVYIKKDIGFDRHIDGGHQEQNKRAGTENVAGIVGLAKAIELAYSGLEEQNQRVSRLRDYFEDALCKKVNFIKINGDVNNRLPGVSHITIDGVRKDSLLLNLDLLKICASGGSACTSGSLTPSHVLEAIGLSKEEQRSSLRISMGKNNTKQEVDYLLVHLEEIIKRLRNI